jgi:hypothetical protein
MKLLWVKEEYAMPGSRNYKRGIGWFKAGTWKLREMRKGSEI